MKNVRNILLISLIVFIYNGCFNDESANNDFSLEQASFSASISEANLPTGIYYTVEKDYRKCMAPMCGGYWIKAVNLNNTVCADGTISDKQGCYVAGLDLNGIELRGDDLIQGEFRKQQYGEIIADHLNVEAAFVPALTKAKSYRFISLIQNNGLRCEPNARCLGYEIFKVNTNKSWYKNGFSYAAEDTNREVLEDAFRNGYETGGALVQGKWDSTDGKRDEFLVTNVYVRNEAPVSEKHFCVFMKQADENVFVSWNVDSYREGRRILKDSNFEPGTEGIVKSTCEDYVGACTREYRPVCGTIDRTGENRTFGNQCVFTNAVRRAAGADSKATGTWTPGECSVQGGEVGDTCGGLMGLTCQEGLFCKYGIKDMCGAFDITGTCSEYAKICPRLYDPVCGCDGRNYPNECAAWQHGISASYKGHCK